MTVKILEIARKVPDTLSRKAGSGNEISFKNLLQIESLWKWRVGKKDGKKLALQLMTREEDFYFSGTSKFGTQLLRCA